VAKQGDDPEKIAEESLPYFRLESEDYLKYLKGYGCLTVAECVLMAPSHLPSAQDDPETVGSHYILLAMHDIACGELEVRHPASHIPYSEYIRLMEAGVFGEDGAEAPIPTAGWLVHLDEAERWLQSKGIPINFDDLRTELSGETVPPLKTSERDSLLKILIGMAVKRYGYNPNAKKNDAVSMITRDVNLAGIKISDDTVRDYLKEAAKKLPPNPE
jgi:hypothetical protein